MSLKAGLQKIIVDARELIADAPVSLERRHAEVGINRLSAVVELMSEDTETVEEVREIASSITQ